MSKLGRQWLDLDPSSPTGLKSGNIAHEQSGVSVGQALEALNAPGLKTEYFTLTAADVASKRVRLSLTCANRASTVVGVCHGPSQRYGVDFIISEDSPNYVYWEGLRLEDFLSEGDQIFVIYEIEHQILGTFTDGGTTPVEPTPPGMPATVRVSDDYTVTKAVTLLVDTTAKGIFVQLPSVATSKDMTVLVKILQGTNPVTIAPQGAELIDQANEELIIEETGASYSLVCDGQGWFLV